MATALFVALLAFLAPAEDLRAAELRVGTLTGTLDACQGRGAFTRERVYLASLAQQLERQLVWVCFATRTQLRAAVTAGSVDIAAAFLQPASARGQASNKHLADPEADSPSIQLSAPIAHTRALVYAPVGPAIAAPKVAYKRSLQRASDAHGKSHHIFPVDTRAQVLLSELRARTVDQVLLAGDDVGDNGRTLGRLRTPNLVTSPAPNPQSRHWALSGNGSQLNGDQLRTAIDQFLQVKLASLQHLELVTDDLDSVSERGLLRVITRPERHGFYISAGRVRGFDHEFLLFFALANNLVIEYLVPQSNAQARAWLVAGLGDIWVTSDPRAFPDTVATPAYRNSQLVLAGSPDVAVTAERLVILAADEHITPQLKKRLQEQFPTAHLQLAKDGQTGLDLLIVAAGDKNTIALIDAGHLSAARRLELEVQRVGKFTQTRDRRWLTRKTSPKLQKKLGDYIRKEADGAFQRVLAQRYYERSKLRARPNNTYQYSEFDETIRAAARSASLDWRLVLALVWVESGFDPRARSHKGAGGIMQIIPETRAQLGLADPHDAHASIRAGVRLLTMLRDRAPKTASAATRTWFAMAGYNAGWTKITRARKRATAMGFDNALWFGHVEAGIRAEPTTRNLSIKPCHCAETVRYLRRIRAQYSAYRYFMPAHADAPERHLLGAAAQQP